MIIYRDVETLTEYGICDNCMARGEIVGCVQEIKAVELLPNGDAAIEKWARYELCKQCNDVLGPKIETNNRAKMQKMWKDYKRLHPKHKRGNAMPDMKLRLK